MDLWAFIKIGLGQPDLASCVDPTHETHEILGPGIQTGPKIFR